jgi:hypothetical protein
VQQRKRNESGKDLCDGKAASESGATSTNMLALAQAWARARTHAHTCFVYACSARTALSLSTLCLHPSSELCFSTARKPAVAAARRMLPAGNYTGWINTFVDRWALPPSGQHACSTPFCEFVAGRCSGKMISCSHGLLQSRTAAAAAVRCLAHLVGWHSPRRCVLCPRAAGRRRQPLAFRMRVRLPCRAGARSALYCFGPSRPAWGDLQRRLWRTAT